MIRLFYVLLLCFVSTSSLSGCFYAGAYGIYKNNQIKNQESIAAMESAHVDKNNRARVRFVGQATIDIDFYRNQKCYGGENKTMVSRKGIDGLFTSKKPFSIGMPQTENTKKLSNKDGFLPIYVNKAFYREYALAAGEPVTISMSYGETTGKTSYSCGVENSYFVPERDKDYEISVDAEPSKGVCVYNISQILSESGEVKVIPLKDRLPAPKCKH